MPLVANIYGWNREVEVHKDVVMNGLWSRDPDTEERV